MENSFFPSSTESNNYKNLVLIFEVIKREYLLNNGIDESNNINIKKNIISSIAFYDMLVSQTDNALSEILEEKSEFLNLFNLEELFLINRMAFLRFKRVGSNLTAFDLYENLKILQV
jgi:hypothetical protein